MKNERGVRLCNLTVSRDREGVVLTDYKGRTRHMIGMVGLLIDIVPNEKAGAYDYSLYVDTLERMLYTDVDIERDDSERPDRKDKIRRRTNRKRKK